VVVQGASNVVELRAGSDQSCVRTGAGDVLCWGLTSFLRATSATRVALDRPATQLATGSYHNCALLDDGGVSCWGWNGYGQHGNGEAETRNLNTPPTRAQLCP